MRVEQEKAGFTPITITLETKEEADIMWAVLNTPFDETKRYAYLRKLDNYLGQLHYEMFKAFSNVLHK